VNREKPFSLKIVKTKNRIVSASFIFLVYFICSSKISCIRPVGDLRAEWQREAKHVMNQITAFTKLEAT